MSEQMSRLDIPRLRSSENLRLEDIPYLPDQLCPHNRKLRHWCPDCREAADLKKVSIRQLHDPEGRMEDYHAL